LHRLQTSKGHLKENLKTKIEKAKLTSTKYGATIVEKLSISLLIAML